MATKVFISWSGELSRQLAEAVREWLPGALQFVKPYFTPEDIEKGARWGSDIVNELESSDIGIVCLTHSNTDSPWILFEAGALSKSLEKSRVCGVLFGLDTTDLKGPLTIFQHTRFQREDFKKLVKTINAAGGDAKLEDSVFDSVFDMWWPRLDQKVRQILNNSSPDGEISNRSERDMLEEILELSRLSTRKKSNREVSSEVLMELLQGIEMMIVEGDEQTLSNIHFIERPLRILAEQLGHPELVEPFIMMRKRIAMHRGSAD